MSTRARHVALALAALAALALPRAAAAQKKIVIDPGHGGQDPGGVGTGLQEKQIVLDVSKRFKDLLDADTADNAGGGSWTALLTRGNDTFVSLAGRAAYANNQGADRFMSIHSNAFGDPSANGTETFSYQSGTTGAALRNLVQEEMVAAWNLRNRGNKTANFAVLRETAMPAVLHELAFITNATDAQKLASPEEREKAAVAHLRAIQRHYDIAPYIPGEGAAGDTGELAGIVVAGGAPLAGASVSLDSGQSVVTGDDGAFLFTGVPVGTRGVTVTADGYEDQVVQVAVDAGQRAETEIEMAPAGGGDDVGGDGDGPDDETGGEVDGDNSISAGCGCRAGGDLAGGATSALFILLGMAVAHRRRQRIL
ncbi:MAG TPA: N-acetylmuramoyl-L-alanine amidase [Kofleriaceae bacterium]|nr:N-acetylmuramoyl-L-alanine amidase [Kofleriaceae bacterium]